MSKKHFKLSPSDFAFLWEECKRCFYLKVVSGFQRPFGAFPKIFTIIDGQMKNYYLEMRTEEISPALPRGVVRYNEKWVESKPIYSTTSSSSCFIKGKFDTALQFDDGTYGIIDFKTSQVKSEHVSLYARQLHSYAHCLENPAPGQFGLSPISKLGLLVYEPHEYGCLSSDRVALHGSITWVDIPRNDDSFIKFLEEVFEVLNLPEPPAASPTCAWCQYRDNSRKTGL